MTIPFRFRPDERENIMRRFGEEFCSRAENDLAAYAERWGLIFMELIPSFSANVTIFCSVQTGGTG